MTDLTIQVMLLELESIKVNQELIEYYKDKDYELAKLIVKNSTESINNSKESIQFFSKL